MPRKEHKFRVLQNICTYQEVEESGIMRTSIIFNSNHIFCDDPIKANETSGRVPFMREFIKEYKILV
jgi:hypothetical protein